MQKSTFVFGMICAMLAGVLTATGSWLWGKTEEPTVPLAAGTRLEIGLPDTRDENNSDIVSSDSAVLWNSDVDIIKFEKNGFERRPIASLTKIMTAMVAIDIGVDWTKRCQL